ncbi:hypothetical protein BN14_02311 [Rhizoctonia solani AG-1 IB]|uniref:Uncharacterized protein n=1 Tax=Thanatephorus cucumeris (strain AG1-IB / isolate 7/3/14) TaxID=1108050 RepID=M5BMZ0_THACB|nr:hypothetical protein BN14_02311 [Rhizoctonia solani AG-1 IB]
MIRKRGPAAAAPAIGAAAVIGLHLSSRSILDGRCFYYGPNHECVFDIGCCCFDHEQRSRYDELGGSDHRLQLQL